MPEFVSVLFTNCSFTCPPLPSETLELSGIPRAREGSVLVLFAQLLKYSITESANDNPSLKHVEHPRLLLIAWQSGSSQSIKPSPSLSMPSEQANAESSVVDVEPEQMQSAVQTSLVVSGLPSSHDVPGNALPPATPSQSISRPSHSHSAVQVSSPVAGSPSSQGVPGCAGPPGTPRQSSSSTGVPSHTQAAVHVSLVVSGLPSSHAVPGNALPPAMPSQSISRPSHSHSSFQRSFPVDASPSSQAAPVVSGPFTTPRQSVQVELKSGSSGSRQTPHSSNMLGPKGTPAQSFGSAKPFTRITRLPPPNVEKRKCPVTGSIMAPSAPLRPVTRSRSVPVIGKPFASTSNTTTFPRP